MIFFTRIYFSPGANSWRAQCAHHQCADIPWAKVQSVSLLACQGLCGRFCCHSVHNKDHGGSQPINKEFSSKVITDYCTLLYKAISKIAKHPTEKVLRQLLSTKQDKHSSNMYHSLWPLDLEASNFSGNRPARSCCASTLCTFLCQRDCPGRHISTDHLAI